MDNMTSPAEQNPGANPNLTSNPVASPDLPLAPVAAAPAPQPQKTNVVPYIIIGVLMMLILVIGIIMIVVFCLANNENKGDINGTVGEDSSESVDDSKDDNTDITTNNTARSILFADLTKEEALAFLRSVKGNAAEAIPPGFLDEAIMDSIDTSSRREVSNNLILRYSYGDKVELEQMAQEWYSMSSWYSNQDGTDVDGGFKIHEYDYYAIVTPNYTKKSSLCAYDYDASCTTLFAFKRDYLNFFQERTTPTSSNAVAYMTTRDPQLVDKLLRIYTFMATGKSRDIYSYSFEEQEDKYVLTLDCVGVGFDYEISEHYDDERDPSDIYAINLYSLRYAVDKSDGHIYAVPAQTESETSLLVRVKSFPITKAEAVELF